jgi:hypothetical protein
VAVTVDAASEAEAIADLVQRADSAQGAIKRKIEIFSTNLAAADVAGDDL